MSNSSRRRGIRRAHRRYQETMKTTGRHSTAGTWAKRKRHAELNRVMSGHGKHEKGCVVLSLWLGAGVIGAIATIKGVY